MPIGLVLARGGSVSIPKKNIAPLANRPLAYYMLAAMVESGALSKVYVSTDDDEIEDVVHAFGHPLVSVFRRSPEFAASESSSEDAIIEFLRKECIPHAEILVFGQITSPLTRDSDVRGILANYHQQNVDSMLSVVRTKRFHWSETGEPLDYDPNRRPRRQDYRGQLVENGALYVTRVGALLESGCRISGSIGLYEMREASLYEVDEPHDLEIVTQLIKSSESAAPKSLKLFASDVDGTLTDATIAYSHDGSTSKAFNMRDGMGFALLAQAGITTAFVTGESDETVTHRAKKLNINRVFSGVHGEAKLEAIVSTCRELGIDLEDVAYIGDDINDLELLQAVGFPACPADAHPIVKQIPRIKIMEARGGAGCVRQFVDHLLACD